MNTYDTRRESSVMGETLESTWEQALRLLLEKGVSEAVNYVSDSPHARHPEIIRWLHSLYFQHRKSLHSWLVNDPVFDPVKSQCGNCEQTWVVHPLLKDLPAQHGPESGYECPTCHRVYCAGCAGIGDPVCRCGTTLEAHLHPNGIEHETSPPGEPTPHDHKDAASGSDESPSHSNLEMQQPPEEVLLLFSSQSPIPIGIDFTFPPGPCSDDSEHLFWAETLWEAGALYQVFQQLKLFPEGKSAPARADLLRARLTLVSWQNAKEDANTETLRFSFDLHWDLREKIWEHLNLALEKAPQCGEAHLLAAQLRMNPAFHSTPELAVDHAEVAVKTLERTPEVLLTWGKSLRLASRPSEAESALREIPEGAFAGDLELSEELEEELQLAQWEFRCLQQPFDAETHFLLARWCWRNQRMDRARELIEKLNQECPNSAEGLHGLAQIEFLSYDSDIKEHERYNRVHQLCRQAIALNPDFPFPYELLGIVYHNLQHRSGGDWEFDFPLEPKLPYCQKAIELGDQCDTALCMVAEALIDQKNLSRAWELLEQAAGVKSRNSSVYFYLQVIYRGYRMHEKETWARRKAKQLSPNTELSSDMYHKILSLCDYEV